MANKNKSKSDQPLMGHWADTAKDNPLTTAAAAAGAVAAGVFLWSKRNQISDQISRLSEQVGDFAEDYRSRSSSRELALTEGPNESAAIEASRATPKRRGTASKSRSAGSRTARARRTTGRAEPQSTVM
jgi:outer membrane murein-binding lipoprotein Lpp